MLTKEQFNNLRYSELKEMATYPKSNSFQRFHEAKKIHKCDGCKDDIQKGEMYVKLKRVFGGKLEKHHIVCHSQ